MEKIQQHIITERVKLNLLPKTYTFEIDGVIYEADWGDIFVDWDEMIESALEQIAIEFGNHSTLEEHEEFLKPLQELHNQLLPNSPIE